MMMMMITKSIQDPSGVTMVGEEMEVVRKYIFSLTDTVQRGSIGSFNPVHNMTKPVFITLKVPRCYADSTFMLKKLHR